jgi:acyl-coenzyme A synthetase/AMP-(fatty) acid ligase
MRIPESRQLGTPDTIPLHPQTAGRNPDFKADCPVKIEEPENALATHPAVAEVSAIGVADEQFGQRLAAFVVLAPGASATPEMLKQHVRENLANYKVPREVVVVDELPRNAIGKIMRSELKARLAGTGQHS